jgi:hypothetical protein
MLPLPVAPYEACEKIAGRVSLLPLVRYRLNDYSVPTEYGHRQVWVKGYVHQVVIACGSELIARHERSYERETVVFNPLHYLALLEQKTRALDQAAPLAGWQLPRLKKHGSREYVQVLRLMETLRRRELPSPLRKRRPPRLDMENYPHLPLAQVRTRRPPIP